MIVGAARSGTSILYRSLQSHPRFTPAGGINLVESHAVRDLMSLLRPSDVRPGPLANFAMGTDALTAVARDVEHLARRRATVRRVAGRSATGLRAWQLAGEHHVVRRYFLEAQRRRGAQRLVEKTPAHIWRVAHLGFAFPSARFLFVIRHPLDTLGSFWKRGQEDPAQAVWANVPPERFADRWTRWAGAALDLSRKEPRFMFIRYEDFTGRTEETVRRILDHIGEPFDPACLLADEMAPPKSASEEAGARAVFGAVRTTTKRWEDYVDRATARDLERRLARPMEQLGYEPRVNVTGTS
jgi:hypothetical protein